MALTEAERARLRAMWRTLATNAANGFVVEDRTTSQPSEWASPLPTKAAGFVLFGLARTAKAWASATKAERGPLEGLLRLHGGVALDLLDAAEPQRIPRPALPFRADLDG